MDGYTDQTTGEARRGYIDVVAELQTRFPDPDSISSEKDKKDFVKLFGEYLRVENILQNYDEFAGLQTLQHINPDDTQALQAFQAQYHLSDEDIQAMQGLDIPSERQIQDYRSTYNDIRDWIRRKNAAQTEQSTTLDWADVVFEVDLLKSQEINLDYILGLILEHHKKNKDKSALIDDIRRIIRSSIGNRAKESLLVDFINQADLTGIDDKPSIIEAFFTFAQGEQQREATELITAENLNTEAAKRYISTSLRRGYAGENGAELNTILPRISPLKPEYLSKKQNILQKIASFVEKFKGVGGKI